MDEIQRIILQVEGEHRLRELTKLIEGEKEAIIKTMAAMREHGQLTTAQAERMGRAGESIASVRKEIEALNKQMGVGGPGFTDRFGAMFLGQSAGRAAGALVGGDVAGAVGMGGMAAEQMAMMSKMSPAAIAGIGIASGVIQAVIQNAGKISDLISNIDPAKLAAATDKVAAATAAWGRMMEAGGTVGERKVAGGMQAFEAENARGLNKTLGDIIAARGGMPLNESQRQRMTSSDRMMAVWQGMPDWMPGKRGAMQQRSQLEQQIRQEQIATLMADAAKPGPEGEQARLTLQGFLKDFPGSFDPSTRDQLERLARGQVNPPAVGLEGARGFVGPPSDAFEPKPPPFMPGRLPVGGRGFAWGNQADARIAAEAASRARKEAREAPMRAPEAAPVDSLGPDAISQQIQQLEESLSHAQSQGMGSAKWFAETNARLQALYARLNSLMQWQSQNMTGQQFFGQYSNMGMVWPPPG